MKKELTINLCNDDLLMERGVANSTNILFNILMKTIVDSTLTVQSTTRAISSNDTFIHIKFTFSSPKYNNYDKVYLKFKQKTNNYDSFILYGSNDEYMVNTDVFKYIHYKVESDGIYRYVDITDLVVNDLGKTYYFAIKQDLNVTSSLELYTNSDTSYKPTLQISYYDDYDFYKKQKYIEGQIGETNNYFVNTRNGKFEYISNFASIEGHSLPLSISLVYNVNKSNTNSICSTITTSLPYGFKFNFQQYIYKDGNNYIYVDGNYKYHTFKKPVYSLSNNLYYESDGNYLLLYIESDKYVIENKQKDKLTFDSNGYLIEINSNINLEKSIKITYDVKDNEINYAKIDNIKDGMDNYFKFKYFNLSGKTYIFILFNNYENLEDYTLIDYKNESIGYIIYSNNYLEMIVDKYKKETTFSFYDDEHKYINKIRRCNEEIEINYNIDLKVKEVFENDYYDYSNEELDIYEERMLCQNKYEFKYLGTYSQVLVKPLNESSRQRTFEYYYNESQECFSMNENINDEPANFSYNNSRNNYDISINDQKNLFVYNPTYYTKTVDGSNHKLCSPDIDNLISSAFYCYVIIIKPKVTKSLNLINDLTATLSIYAFDDIDSPDYHELYPRTFKLSMEHNNVLVYDYIQDVDKLKYLYFELNVNIDYEVIAHKIFTEGNISKKELVNITDDEVNLIYNINEDLEYDDVTMNNTSEIIDDLNKLTFSDIIANYDNYNSSTGNYNFWYNKHKYSSNMIIKKYSFLKKCKMSVKRVVTQYLRFR